MRPLLLVGEAQRGAALVSGDDDQRQPTGVGGLEQQAVVLHLPDCLPQHADPLPVARRERLACCVVGLDQLTGERVICGRTGIADASQVAEVQIDPALEVVEGVQCPEFWLAVKVQYHPDLARDDRAKQLRLVREVVRQLRAAHRCGLAQGVHVQRRKAFAEDQFGGDFHDPITGDATLGGQAPVVLPSGKDHGARLTRLRWLLWDVQPTHRRGVSSGSGVCFPEEGVDQLGHLVQCRLQQEMASVEQMNFGVG